MSQGSHVINIFANDSAGNENSTNLTFFIDSVFPIVDFGIGTNLDRQFLAREIALHTTPGTQLLQNHHWKMCTDWTAIVKRLNLS